MSVRGNVRRGSVRRGNVSQGSVSRESVRSGNCPTIENFMILNPNKCHYMCIGKNTESDIFKFENVCLENSKEEVILGIAIDNKLIFDSHIKSMCRKVGQKLSALSRISPYLETNKKELLFKFMVKSQYNYCRLVWMLCSRNANNLINKIQESSLRLITNDKTNTFEHLLQANN